MEVQTQQLTKQQKLDFIKEARKLVMAYGAGAGIFFIATFAILGISNYAAVVTVLIAAFCAFKLLSLMGKIQRYRAEIAYEVQQEALKPAEPQGGASEHQEQPKPQHERRGVV